VGVRIFYIAMEERSEQFGCQCESEQRTNRVSPFIPPRQPSVRDFARLDCLGLSDYLIAIFSGDVFGFVDVFGSVNGRDVFGKKGISY